VLGVEMSLRALFEAPTVEQLAARVESLRGQDPAANDPIALADHSAPPPASFAQERLWFLDRLEPGGAFYNVPTALRLRGPLHVPALERALGGLLRCHEALRTVFTEVDGTVVQAVKPFGDFVLPIRDLTGANRTEAGASGHRQT